MTESGDGITAPRVALLARPGAAADRLHAALADIGLAPVLVADPLETDPATLAAASPGVLVVVLDPAVEDALERFDAVLADPAVDVLFEEADLAVAREGWDAARWARHLAAKVLRHGDVLPPGGEQRPASADDDFPTPGRPPTPAQLAEARVEAFDLDAASDLAAGIPAGDRFDPVAAEFDPVAAEFDAGSTGFDPVTAGFDPVAAGFEPADSLDPPDHLENVPGMSAEDIAVPARPEDEASSLPDIDAPAETPGNDGGLALADADGPGAQGRATASPAGAHPHARDLAEIERRIASMALEDGPEPSAAGAAPVAGGATAPAGGGGAVLVFAGIGGPDAVRQFIGGLPPGFPRPVLVQQRLDGARYDRLVQQMARATGLPVELAEPGKGAHPGTVYIVPPVLTVAAGETGLSFVPGEADGAIAALPADDSAVLLFSGSDAALVDAAMRQAGAGALVAGQAPEGCYDAAAANAVLAAGGQAGDPAELAQRLVARWMA